MKMAKEGKVGACTRQERFPLMDGENDFEPNIVASFSPWHLLLHTTARVMDTKRKIKITQTITVKHNPSVSTPFDSNITNMHAFTHCCTSFHKLLHEHNSYYDGIMTSEKWKLRKIIIKKNSTENEQKHELLRRLKIIYCWQCSSSSFSHSSHTHTQMKEKRHTFLLLWFNFASLCMF